MRPGRIIWDGRAYVIPCGACLPSPWFALHPGMLSVLPGLSAAEIPSGVVTEVRGLDGEEIFVTRSGRLSLMAFRKSVWSLPSAAREGDVEQAPANPPCHGIPGGLGRSCLVLSCAGNSSCCFSSASPIHQLNSSVQAFCKPAVPYSN